MKNVKEEFKKFCLNNKLDFSEEKSIKSYDNSTFFCPAGMQQYSDLFKKEWIKGTSANIQSCLRINDIEEIGDGSHLIVFDMLGLFSFRELTVKNAVDLWILFVEKYLGLKIDKITIHPDKLMCWSSYIYKHFKIEADNDCKWTDGKTSGYCIEFYVNGIEVGNIVNTEGDCIDAGFGLERLDTACNETVHTKENIIKNAVKKIIETGAEPSNTKQGYILRKLLNLAVKNKLNIPHQFYKDEEIRIKKMQDFYDTNKDKLKDMSKEWWKETHGVDIENLTN